LSLVSRLWQQKIRNITLFPKRCYAINLDNGGRYCLTDNGGCAFEKGLFPEWKRKNNFKAEVYFKFLAVVKEQRGFGFYKIFLQKRGFSNFKS